MVSGLPRFAEIAVAPPRAEGRQRPGEVAACWGADSIAGGGRGEEQIRPFCRLGGRNALVVDVARRWRTWEDPDSAGNFLSSATSQRGGCICSSAPKSGDFGYLGLSVAKSNQIRSCTLTVGGQPWSFRRSRQASHRCRCRPVAPLPRSTAGASENGRYCRRGLDGVL